MMKSFTSLGIDGKWRSSDKFHVSLNPQQNEIRLQQYF